MNDGNVSVEADDNDENDGRGLENLLERINEEDIKLRVEYGRTDAVLKIVLKM